MDFSIFFSQKVLDNGTILTVRTFMQPIQDEQRCGYGISVKLMYKDNITYNCLNDFTTDKKFAEKLFNIVTASNVFPCHLSETAEDLLVAEYGMD